MYNLYRLFGNDVTSIIISKTKTCRFEGCNKEPVNNYCKRHWCITEHPTNQKKYRGYCENCYDSLKKS